MQSLHNITCDTPRKIG